MKQITPKTIVCIKKTVASLLFLLMASWIEAQPNYSFVQTSETTNELQGHKHLLIKGELLVPEDRQKPKALMLHLPVLIIKSLAQSNSEPIFWFDGGPGASNILSLDKIKHVQQQQLMAQHDFVCIGYRGTDGNVLLHSKKINKAFKGTGHQLLSDRSLDKIEHEIKKYTAQLQKKGININCYTIMDVIDDMEAARLALGYKKINCISVSYGTRVALLYSYKYPEALNKTVMIGACPPGYFLPRAEQAELTIGQYDSLYQLQASATNTYSIKTAMQQAFDNMPKRWSVYKLDKDKIKAGTMGALYTKGFSIWAFNEYLRAAYSGDYRGLFLLQKLYDRTTRSFIGDIYAKTVSADMSNDTSASFPGRDELRQSKTLLGNNVAVIYGSTAKLWNIQSIPAAYKTCRLSETETLVISGALDFRTPATITEKALMPFLRKGQHLVLKNSSHTDILQNVMKSPDFLHTYFDKNKIDSALITPASALDFSPAKPIGKLKLFVIGLLL